MKTKAPSIYPAYYFSLEEIVHAFEAGHPELAKGLGKTILNELLPSVNTPEGIQALFFLEALQRNLGTPHTSETGNLYLMPDQGQQIKMFNFMASKFPLVRAAQDIVNSAYAKRLQQEQDIVLLDIGIGTGQQMVRLIEQLADTGHLPKRITVIGIEPANESLKLAEANLLGLNDKHPLSLRFIPVHKTLEAFREEDWQQLETVVIETLGPLIINASFALHHVYPPTIRPALFGRLKHLNPAVFALIEPYADFLETNLHKRFQHAWHHYGLTFQAIDQIEAPLEDKSLLKKVFFSREIQDVLSTESSRIEQFETGEMWADRLRQAGFHLKSPNASNDPLPDCPFVTIVREADYISFNVDGFPIVSILIADLV